MSLGTAEEESTWSKETYEQQDLKDLRAQMEEDYKWIGKYQYTYPDAAKGEWDSVTTNRPQVVTDKIISILIASTMQLYIDVDEDTRKKNTSISKTEQLANGVIWKADREAIKVPSGKSTKEALSSMAVWRGGTALMFYWYKDKDGNLQPFLKVYDPLCCVWEEGDGELEKFGYREWMSEKSLRKKYKGKIDGGSGKDAVRGKLLRETIWDKDEWRVIVNGNYVDDGKAGKHGLGYIPVFIRSCGAIPHLHTESDDESTMKYSWQSYAANTRGLFGLESKLLTIGSSKAADSGGQTLIGEYDSTGGVTPPDVTMTRNRINTLFFDKAKGAKYNGFMTMPGNEVVDQFLPQVVDRENAGMLDPITQGIMSQAGSGALAQELNARAQEFINKFRRCVEENYIWAAEEAVRQFKNQELVGTKITVEGREWGNQSRSKFYAEISPKDVEEKHFECNLVPDKLRDKIQNLGAAIQGVKAGLYSEQTAMVDFNLHADPQKELERIRLERAAKFAEQDPLNYYDNMALWHKKEGNERMALYYQELAEEVIEEAVQKLPARKAGMMMPEAANTGESLPGQPMTPQMQAGAIAAKPERI